MNFLGLTCNSSDGSFVSRAITFDSQITKRNSLSHIFYQIGVVGPSTFTMKVVLQCLWVMKID